MKVCRLTIASLLSASALAMADGSTAKLETPRPAPEIAERAKVMAGAWRCDGTAATLDGKGARITGSMSTAATLDGFWVHQSFQGAVAGMNFKYETFATFDAGARTWRVVMLDNWGSSGAGTAGPMKDGKLDVEYETVGLLGKGAVRSHLDVSDPSKGAHVWGEVSLDGGKTWLTNHDMRCTK